ncbi:hypothetical protein AB0A99_05460 [Streptomyces fradiae]|uniref:hypothetical protein n=1 Tax=Streptomyces fradiae TaxID=1906 RepID=UPI0034113806
MEVGEVDGAGAGEVEGAGDGGGVQRAPPATATASVRPPGPVVAWAQLCAEAGPVRAGERRSGHTSAALANTREARDPYTPGNMI